MKVFSVLAGAAVFVAVAIAPCFAGEVHIELAKKIAKLQCPNLGRFPEAMNDLAQVFGAKGEVNEEILGGIQANVLEFSEGTVKLLKIDSSTICLDTPLVNLLAEDSEGGKTRKYIIIKGFSQILCEEIRKDQEISFLPTALKGDAAEVESLRVLGIEMPKH